jgi:hypothetical protein
MKYEITIPAAQGMIEQERKTKSQVAPHGSYVETVSADIMRRHWLEECGGQRTVDAVLAMLDKITNAEGYARYALHEAARQLARSEPGSMRRHIHIVASFDRCPVHPDVPTQAVEDLYRPAGTRFCPQCGKERGSYNQALHRVA